MEESIKIVALDQHAASVMAAVLVPGQRRRPCIPFGGFARHGRWVARLRRRGPIRCCFEAGPCGSHSSGF